MNIYKDKTLLIAGGIEALDLSIILHAFECGAKEIRMFDNNEERLVAMRDELLAQNPEAATKVKYYCADVCDIESIDDSMPGVDLILCVPTLKLVADIESYPYDACITLLESADNVMQSAINRGAEKVVVLSPVYNEPLYKTPDLLAALLKKNVVAQGRYQKKSAKTTISCPCMDNDVIGLADFAFAEAKNGDLVLRQDGVLQCVPCYNPDFVRNDFTNV